ncbi:DUF3347 domain-containing protein [Flavobacterium hibisci]|uniref:DUF3347 domain-containing protein n=1 Tax=Flavobacterium hibisci TaxID=1914462 RepID=UPI001CBA835A|nr:DUF3347 domain-containing protein [Flavobacterium hibisci]
MYPFKNIMMAIFLLLSVSSQSQVKNDSTENIKIYGNCSMCKDNIEHAGNQKNVAAVIWDKNTKMASVTYDPKKTNTDQILKRIALAGYDNSSFLAPQLSYDKLPDCCKYVRELKKAEPKSEMVFTSHKVHNQAAQAGPFQTIYDAYFALNDAFIQSDTEAVASKAKGFVDAVSAVKMESLSEQEHIIWMKVNSVLTEQSGAIATAKGIDKQRESFKGLSKNLYELLKTAKGAAPVYYQYCPMADANWLSRENTIKNPYYGVQMLSCGKTVETIP